MGYGARDIADLCDHYNKGMTHYYTQAELENRDADTVNRLIQTAVDYQDYPAGITLSIVPHISRGDFLRLNLVVIRGIHEEERQNSLLLEVRFMNSCKTAGDDCLAVQVAGLHGRMLAA